MNPARATFAPDLSSVGQARRFVRGALIDLGVEEMEFEAAQLVSELATNSVIHAGTPFDVQLDHDGRLLRIAVSDASPRGPVAKSHSAQATTGRGLKLVATLADQWGTEARPDGKTVWCTLRLGRGRSAVPFLAEPYDASGPSERSQPGAPPGRRGLRNQAPRGIAA